MNGNETELARIGFEQAGIIHRLRLELGHMEAAMGNNAGEYRQAALADYRRIWEMQEALAFYATQESDGGKRARDTLKALGVVYCECGGVGDDHSRECERGGTQ